MPPETSRDFQRAAAERLNAAEVFFREGLTLDAQYLGGYTVECSLKALILEKTAEIDREDAIERISSGAHMHRSDTLLRELRAVGVELPIELVKRMRRFEWSTDLRYETGRLDRGETVAFLKTARAVHRWVGGRLP